MKCPYCSIAIHKSVAITELGSWGATNRADGKAVPHRSARAFHQLCPECKGLIIELQIVTQGQVTHLFVAHPKGTTRPIASEVPDPYRSDFREASLVLDDSAKASAAISRRCLQAVLRDKGQTKSKDLADQIDELVNAGAVPGYVAEGLHALRNIGNFGSHPIKSKNTGEIVDVEPGEAEWNLDVLESIFDFYFVQPALTAKRKTELNKKLMEAGKPEIK